MMEFSCLDDVRRFASEQLGDSLLPDDEMERCIEQLVDLIASRTDFRYGDDCENIIEELWASGRGFWPIGENTIPSSS